jgi:maleate isomerase
MNDFSYELTEFSGPKAGLVVLQTDEVIEREMRAMIPQSVQLMITRIPSGHEVTPESLGAMETALPRAAGLLPRGLTFDVIGYGCTSATAQIGPQAVAEQIRAGAPARAITQPVSGLIAACQALDVNRLAFLSPYIKSVSLPLRALLGTNGIATPVFGSFNEAQEVRVARISERSIARAAKSLAAQGDVDAVFLSCTNLACLGVIAELEAEIGVPVLSSNLVLGWHMGQLAGGTPINAPGRLASHQIT